MRETGYNYSPRNASGLNKSDFPSMVLKVEILSGQHIPRPAGDEKGEVIDPYVEVSIKGHHDDYSKPENKKKHTKSVHNNGFNPTWKESMEFHITRPELAFVEFRVKKENKL